MGTSALNLGWTVPSYFTAAAWQTDTIISCALHHAPATFTCEVMLLQSICKDTSAIYSQRAVTIAPNYIYIRLLKVIPNKLNQFVIFNLLSTTPELFPAAGRDLYTPGSGRNARKRRRNETPAHLFPLPWQRIHWVWLLLASTIYLNTAMAASGGLCGNFHHCNSRKKRPI